MMLAIQCYSVHTSRCTWSFKKDLCSLAVLCSVIIGADDSPEMAAHMINYPASL